MAAQVKWGILGDAGIARKALIPAMKRARNAELAAIATRSGNASEAAAEYGIDKGYESYEALLADKEIDAVYIPLPNGIHAEWVKKAAEAGKHVLCEKPAALNTDEAVKMIEACRRHGVTFMEAFMYRFHPQHARVKDVIAAGEIGEVKFMQSSFAFRLDDPNNIRFDCELGGGALYDVGCYCINATRYILGAEPTEAYARAHMSEGGVDLTTAGVLSFENGVQAAFDCSFETAPRESYEIVGTEGTIKVNGPFRPDKNEDGKGHVIVQRSEGNRREESVEGDAYRAQVEHFSKCVIDESETLYPAEETLRNMKVIDACLASIRSGKPEEIRRSK